MTLRPNLICLLLLFLTTVIVSAEPTRDPATATTVNTVPPELPTATPASVGMSAVKLAKITDSMQNLVDTHRVAGAVAIVIRKGKVVYFQAAGQRNIAGNLPMEKDTIMRFYSMTKPITTVAAMILVEEGKLQKRKTTWTLEVFLSVWSVGSENNLQKWKRSCLLYTSDAADE